MSNYGPDSYYGPRERPEEPAGIRVRNGVDLGGFLGILSRQIIWILIGLAITFGLAFFYIFFSGLSYTSTISILIDARERQAIGSDSQPIPQQADPLIVESQLKLMTSASVLRRVAIAENLESDPEFAPSDRVGAVGGLMNLISRGKVDVPPMDQITEALTQRITVKRPERSYVVDLDVKASNPSKAARLANAVAKAFIEEERAAGEAYQSEQSDWVIKRTKELRDKVELAEKKVQDYKAQNGIVDVQGTLTQEQQLQDANRDLVAARTKSGEAQSRYDQVKKILASGRTLDGTYDAINSTVIRQLRVQYADLVRRQAALSQKYGTRHPEYIDIVGQTQSVQSQITEELKRIASALQNEATVAHDNAEAAQRRVQILEQKTTATNEVSLQLKELLRLADGERTNYEKFLRANDSIRRDPIETPYARIVAPASFPQSPSSPKTLAALMIAASAGLSLGIGLAVVMDRGSASRDLPGTPYGGPQPTPPTSPGYPPYTPSGPGATPRDRRTSNPAHAEPAAPAPLPSSNPFAIGPAQPYPAPGNGVEETGFLGFAARLFKPRRAPEARPMAATANDDPIQYWAPDGLSDPIDPRQLLSELVTDLANGDTRRVILTAQRGDMQKTELALVLAKGLAARGHAVLLIDGDENVAALSHLALRDGVPARIPFEGLEVQVLGIPCLGDGVVFVLPQQSVTGDMSIVDAPRIHCRIRAVIVEAPREGIDLARFRALGDAAYLVDPQGGLRLVDLDARISQAMQAAGFRRLAGDVQRRA
jgi:uncharacterized protein involved in exopolysaccharide biosynthesis